MAEDIDKWRLAGRISAQALEHGISLIRKGGSLLEVCDAVDKKIFELGAKPSFPSQISINDIAAHFCPDSDDQTTFDSQVAKLDVGASVDGYLGDTAATVDLSGNNNNLVKASREALDNAIKVVRPGVSVREVGAVIQDVIAGYGFNPVVNLSGHGLGMFQIHTQPTVPNFDNGDATRLVDGQVIAIEPFATSGSGAIYESSNPTVFMEISKKPIRSSDARLILSEIQSYGGLPFTKRWLTRKFPAFKVSLALKQMINEGMIQAFPPLIEKGHGLVSQAEHTILVKDKPEILTKSD